MTTQLTLADATLDVTADGVAITDAAFVAAVQSLHGAEVASARPAYVARGLAAGTLRLQGEYVVAAEPTVCACNCGCEPDSADPTNPWHDECACRSVGCPCAR